MASLNLKNCLSIPDDFDGYSKNLFCIPKHYEACVGNVLIPAGVIQVNFVKSFIFRQLYLISRNFYQDRIEKLAYDIFSDVVKDAKVDQIHAICVLKGDK